MTERERKKEEVKEEIIMVIQREQIRDTINKGSGGDKSGIEHREMEIWKRLSEKNLDVWQAGQWCGQW
ncbi:hypothetical protein PUN28_011851 [Cardiocondyla obscurior]|uniref:Uncharacterized protein n=1 Tax=Cardiocondyla obscurior TaxID=286306 RepID=A0AAW2FIC8_9HYME